MSIVTTFTIYLILALTATAFTALVNHANKPKKDNSLHGWAIIDGEYINFDEVPSEV